MARHHVGPSHLPGPGEAPDPPLKKIQTPRGTLRSPDARSPVQWTTFGARREESSPAGARFREEQLSSHLDSDRAALLGKSGGFLDAGRGCYSPSATAAAIFNQAARVVSVSSL